MAVKPGSIDEKFLGTWRMVGVERIEVETGKRLDEDLVQTGYISYTPDHRMMVIISHVQPNGHEEITCYAAKWHVEGEAVIHSIDIAIRQPWVNTRQVRNFNFTGNRLTLTPPVSEDYVHKSVTRRSLMWEKVED